MSRNQVLRQLGEPDRRATLDGKVLRSATPVDEAEPDRRVVYFYHASGLQIWLQNSKVTGVLRNGVSVR